MLNGSKILFREGRYFFSNSYFLWIVRYFFGDQDASVEIKILVLSSGYFFEDCKTS